MFKPKHDVLGRFASTGGGKISNPKISAPKTWRRTRDVSSRRATKARADNAAREQEAKIAQAGINRRALMTPKEKHDFVLRLGHVDDRFPTRDLARHRAAKQAKIGKRTHQGAWTLRKAIVGRQ